MSDYKRAGTVFGLSATYSATANYGNGQATGQGITALDTYPGRWISVQVTGLGAGSASATFAVQYSNLPTTGFVTTFLQDATQTTTASQSGLQADTVILHGPIRARYARFVTTTAATAGAGTTATATMTIWDTPGQTIG